MDTRGARRRQVLLDISYTIRSLLRAPTLTTCACLVIALGVGVNVAVFSVADAALLRPLPYTNADRLVHVYQMATTVAGERVDTSVAPSRISMLRQFTHIFEAVEPVRFGRTIGLDTGFDVTIRIGGFAPGLPALLGARPVIGRVFTVEDRSGTRVVVLSDAYWARAYGRDPQILGRSLRFQGQGHTIIGVMPPSFRYFAGSSTDVWFPVDDDEATDIAARLRPGLTIARAQRELDDSVARLSASGRRPEFWIRPADWRRSSPPPGAETIAQTLLLGITIAALLVLVIACANIGNFVNERMVARDRELAIQVAIGAPSSAIVRLVLLESVSLALMGGIVALVTISWTLGALPRFMPPGLLAGLLAFSLPTDGLRLWVAGIGGAVSVGLLIGLIPAVRAGRRSVESVVVSSSQPAFWRGRKLWGVRQLFQACQLGVTLVLLIGTGLALTSFTKLIRTPDGFQASGLLHVSWRIQEEGLTGAQRAAIVDDLARRIAVLPGVVGAAVGPAPVSEGYSTERWEPVGHPDAGLVWHFRRFPVGPDYFSVAAMRVEEGRGFGPDDRQGAERVIVVTRNAAASLWPGKSAIGKQITMSEGGRPYTIVGVLGDLKITDIENSGVELFVPAAQWGPPSGILVRFGQDARAVAEAIREMASSRESRVTIERVATVEHLRSESDPLGYSRFLAAVLTLFAALGMVTSMMGLYGVTASVVRLRTRDFATRMVLGANTHHIVRLLLADTAVALCGGVLMGLWAAHWLASVFALRLFEVSVRDPTIWSLAVGVVVMVSLTATWAPVRRATRIAPSQALRVD